MRVFHRSLGTRALSVGSLIFFALLGSYHLATGGGLFSAGSLILGSLLLLSGAASLLNLGDRYRIDDEGIHYANPVLSRLGLRIDRGAAWREVVSIRAHRGLAHGSRESAPSALFLELASGRRFVIDSVESLEEVKELIAAHLEARAVPPGVRPQEGERRLDAGEPSEWRG